MIKIYIVILFLSFLDGQILDFLKIILPSIKKIDIHFLCKIAEWNANNIRICPIRRLLTILAPKISALCLRNDANLCNFNRLFPGFIEEIQHIAIRSRRSDWNVLMKWLNTERTDGEPKVLSTSIGEEGNNFVDRVKQVGNQMILIYYKQLGGNYSLSKFLRL
jgi:hypothetical protein